MGSTFFGLNVALSGIMAQQRALNTVSHNITNATTQGFTRQRVDLAAAVAYPMPGLNTAVAPGQIGTGVVATQHTRIRDTFVDVTIRNQAASVGQWDARATGLKALDTIIDEPGETGLTSLLSAFWGSFQALSVQPDSAAAREAVRAAGENLAQGFRDLDQRLAEAQDEATGRIALEVGRVNELAAQINELNQQISTVVATGQQPNDLRDMRDLLVDELAGFAGIAVSVGGNDRYSISVGTQLLVDGGSDTVNALAIDAAGNATVGGAAITLANGSLRGLVDLRDSVIGGPGGYISQLDALAASITGSVNTVHAGGYGLDGSTGNDFFAGTTAATIGISAAVAGSVDAIAASSTAGGIPGDGANVVALAQLQFVVQTIGTSTTTLDGFYQQFVAKLGVDADQAYRMSEVQHGVFDAALARRDSVSGVNIDEEASDMIRFTKSYNAAARMVTAVDEMLETIISRMGIVGR